MKRKTRIWMGMTLGLVLLINYVIIGYPLAKKNSALRKSADSILIRQVKKGQAFKGSDEDYVLEILKRERVGNDRKMRNLNAAALTCIVIIVSWTAFGVIFSRKK